MIYLDANVIIASVTPVAEATEATARLLRGPVPCYVSALADYEVRKYLARLADGAEANLNLLLAQRFSQGKEWEAAILQAVKLAKQFKTRLWVDSADTLHVGWALAIGAEVFASFDRASGPRALALCMGLKLWPDVGPKDYEQLKLLKG
jgi:predicted nucleic acid-binding protein